MPRCGNEGDRSDRVGIRMRTGKGDFGRQADRALNPLGWHVLGRRIERRKWKWWRRL